MHLSDFVLKMSLVIVPVNENFHMKLHKIPKNAEKQLIELLLTESATVITKVRPVKDGSVNR